MQATIYITLKKGVLDPQGKAIESGLASLNFHGVSDVTQGKVITMTLSETDRAKAEESVKQMCQKLLANSVIENYRFDLAI